MPILNTRRTGAAAAAQESRINQAWPAAITLIAVIVFVVFLVQSTLIMALMMTMATLVAGAVLLTLVVGTGWITELRLLIPNSRRNR